MSVRRIVVNSTTRIVVTLTSALAMTALLASCGSSVPQKESRTAAERPAAGTRVTSAALVTGRFNCELGNKVEVESNAKTAAQLTWKGKTYAMTPVSTSTGAVRFENQASGLVWIQIPAKSMLLNTRQGAQLANECRVH